MAENLALTPELLAGPLRSSYIARFNRTWASRTRAAQAAGMDLNSLRPIMEMDRQRVESGSQPLNSIEAGLAVRSALNGGKAIVKAEDTGHSGPFGLLGNAVQDFGDLASSLNPMKLVPALYDQVADSIEHPQRLLRPLDKLVGGDIPGAVKSASRTPLWQLVPGVYTANNVLQGDFEEIYKHPLFTALDVTPFATKFGKLAVGKEAAKVVGSPAEALAAGRPLKAGLRAVGGRSPAPKSQFGLRAMEAGQNVWRTSDAGARLAEHFGLDKATRDLSRFHSQLRRQMGMEAEKVWEETNGMLNGMDEAERAVLYDQAVAYNPVQTHGTKVLGDDGQPVVAYHGTQHEFDKFDMDKKVTGEGRALYFSGNQTVAAGYAGTTGTVRPQYLDIRNPYYTDFPYSGLSGNEIQWYQDNGYDGLIMHDPARPGSKEYVVFDAEQIHDTPDLLTSNMDEAHETIIRNLRTIANGYNERGVASGDLIGIPHNGGIEYYPTDSKVGKAYKAVQKREERMGREASKVDAYDEQLTIEDSPELMRKRTRQQDRLDRERMKADVEYDEFQLAMGKEPPARFYPLLEDLVKKRLSGESGVASAAETRGVTRAQQREAGLEHQAVAQAVREGDKRLRTQLVDANAELKEAARVMRATQREYTAKAKQARDVGNEVVYRPQLDQELAEVDARLSDAVDALETAKANQASINKQVEASKAKAKARADEPKPRVLASYTPPGGLFPKIPLEERAAALENIVKGNFKPLIDEGYLTKADFDAIIDDVSAEWQKLSDAGYDPIYMPFVPASKMDYLLDQKPLAGNVYTPRPFLDSKLLSFVPGIQDVAVSLSHYGVELLKQDASKTMFEHVRRMAVSEEQLAEFYGIDKARVILAQKYTPFSITAGRYLSRREMSAIPDKELLFIPREMDRSLNRLMGQFARDGLKGAYDKVMKVYKYAVLTGPRHIAHVLFGGLMFMGLEQGAFPLMKIAQARKWIKEGLPPEFVRGLDYFTADEISSWGQGKTLGRLWMERAGSPFRAMRTFEETLTDTYRAMSYLREFEKRGGKAADSAMGGAGKGAAHEAAMLLVNKIYMDIDGLAPIERTVLRQIFPFYTFTKQIIRYMLNYPADHPMRAAILGRIAEIEMKDHESGLPAIFRDFFYLGGQDKEGNVVAMDAKTFNPFRSLDGSNPFTLGGFLSALTPVITAPATLAGFNTLTATGELYPSLTYDHHSGKLVAKHPDVIQKAIGTFLPPSNAIQGLIGTTESWRRLRETNPDGYWRAVTSAMNLPMVPQRRNMKAEAAKAELNRYRVAQQDVQKALHSGDSTSLEGYDLVPFQGDLVPVENVKKLIERLKTSGYNPSSVLPRATHRNVSLVGQ